MIWQRWVSALAGLILIFGTLYLAHVQGLAILCSLVAFIASVEYSRLYEKFSLWSCLFLVANALVYWVQLMHPQYLVPSMAMILICLAAIGLVLFRNQEPMVTFTHVRWPLWGLMYVGLFPAFAIFLLRAHGWSVFIFLLVTIFTGDVGAFFAGRFIGGPKIFPNFSPKKTISGAIGGLIASCACGMSFLILYADFPGPGSMFMLCLTIALFAQFGDFFESLLKRVSGKKDSGHIMPGHGGFLDRLDGVYFGSAVLYFFCMVLGFGAYF